MPLPLRVRYQEGEPANGIVHRLATRWGMSRTVFERFAGLDRETCSRGAHASEVAILAGFAPAAVVCATPSREPRSRRMRIGGAWTDLSDLTGRGYRVCPACLAEDRRIAEAGGAPPSLAAWLRQEWCVRSVATCARHGRLLVEACPVCLGRLDGDNPAVDVCRCGAALYQVSAPALASAVDILLVRAIAGDVPQWVDGAGLHQISTHLTRLGAVASGWSAEMPVRTGTDRLVLRETGLDMIRRRRGATKAALDALVSGSRPGVSGRTGLTAAYGWVWRAWLGVPTANPLDARFREEVRSHARALGVCASPTSDGEGLTLAQAGTRLGSGHARTRRLVTGAGLLSGCELPGVAMSLDRAGVEALASRLAETVDAKDAAATLGIDRIRLRSLVAAGLVARAALPDVSSTIGRYDRSLLGALVDAVAGDAPRLRHPPTGCHPLTVACRNASVRLEVVVQSLLDGRIRAVARTPGTGLDCVWVTVRDLRSLAAPAPSSIRSAARRLGLHYEAARRLAAEGMLGLGPALVDEASIESFAAAFLTSAQAGAEFGLSARAASALMKHTGAVPAFGPPNCRQEIWSRATVSRVGVAEVARR